MYKSRIDKFTLWVGKITPWELQNLKEMYGSGRVFYTESGECPECADQDGGEGRYDSAI